MTYTTRRLILHECFPLENSKEFDAAIVELMEKNRAQAKEIKSLKMEQESQAMMLCEITKQKKRPIEDRDMLEDDKETLQIDLRRNP